LTSLRGKIVYIGTYGGAHNHFRLRNLKLGRLKVERFRGGNNLPSVIVLWETGGKREDVYRPTG